MAEESPNFNGVGYLALLRRIYIVGEPSNGMPESAVDRSNNEELGLLTSDKAQLFEVMTTVDCMIVGLADTGIRALLTMKFALKEPEGTHPHSDDLVGKRLNVTREHARRLSEKGVRSIRYLLR